MHPVTVKPTQGWRFLCFRKTDRSSLIFPQFPRRQNKHNGAIHLTGLAGRLHETPSYTPEGSAGRESTAINISCLCPRSFHDHKGQPAALVRQPVGITFVCLTAGVERFGYGVGGAVSARMFR